MRTILQLVLILLILVIAAAFAALNDQTMQLNYFIGIVDTRLSHVIIISFILGALFSLAIFSMLVVRQRLQMRRLRQALKSTQQEVSNLRELPVKDSF